MCEVRKSKTVSPMVDFSIGLLNACYSYVFPLIMAEYCDYTITDFEIQAYHDDIRSMLGPQVARNKKLLTKGQH
jgi:hypothetical protein